MERLSLPDVDDRILVLQVALLVENYITSFLGKLLDIDDTDNSKSLGKNGISFHYKVMLLIDIGALNDGDRTKFQKFMEVRNTFMHDMRATNYTECVARIEGLERWLEKTYKTQVYNKKEGITREELIEERVRQLANEVIALTFTILEKLREKFDKSVEADQQKRQVDAFKKTIEEIKDFLNNYVQKYIDDKEMIKPENLAKLGDTINRMFYSGAAKLLFKDE